MEKKSSKKVELSPAALRPDAAGIDIGPTEIYVAVGADRDPEPVRSFETFTGEWNRLADWLEQCGIGTVAMESTGVYWIPLFQILEGRGLEVYLVNARHYKNVPGRKTDVADCQWLPYLHAVGLLRGSFRPAEKVCALRTLLRHREGLVQAASQEVQHRQKALDQMNLQLHHVISDITGVTGLAIVDAILAGEREGRRLAQLRDGRIRASEETIIQSLQGDYRAEHLFTLQQSLQAYRYYRKLIGQCEREMRRQLDKFDSKIDVEEHPLPPSSKKTQARADEFELRPQQYRIFGVDLTQVPGLNTQTIQVLLGEIGPDFSKFPTASAFVSWLGLCPNNEVSGGKVLRTRTRKVKNRTALALRLAAQSLHHQQSALGAFYRRMRAKLGAPKAITAAAHKLARIIYHLVTAGQSYDESIFILAEKKHAARRMTNLTRQARELGYELAPIPAAVVS